MNIYGQTKLVAQFNNFTLDTLPHAIMLSGPFGSGRHTLVSMLVEKLNLEVVELTTINNETLEELRTRFRPTMCIIKGEDISLKEESALLKCIEEPPAHIYFSIICVAAHLMLPTIVNRCINFKIEPYSKEELKLFANPDTSDLVFKVADTPGKMLLWKDIDLKSYNSFINRIFDGSVKRTSFGSLFRIVDTIKFTDKDTNAIYDKDLFFAILLLVIKEKFMKASREETKETFEQYKLTSQFITDTMIPNIDIKKLFECYLFDLKEIGV